MHIPTNKDKKSGIHSRTKKGAEPKLLVMMNYIINEKIILNEFDFLMKIVPNYSKIVISAAIRRGFLS